MQVQFGYSMFTRWNWISSLTPQSAYWSRGRAVGISLMVSWSPNVAILNRISSSINIILPHRCIASLPRVCVDFFLLPPLRTLDQRIVSAYLSSCCFFFYHESFSTGTIIIHTRTLHGRIEHRYLIRSTCDLWLARERKGHTGEGYGAKIRVSHLQVSWEIRALYWRSSTRKQHRT